MTKVKEKKEKIVEEEIIEEKVPSELEVMTDKFIRLQAEFQNFKTRKENEIKDIYKYDGESVIKEILPVIDNFERAISMDDNDLSDEVSQFLSGFKMIYTSILSTLEKLGVKELDIIGKEFDPTISEAVLVENNEEKPANVVLEVLQKGYSYKERVIRPAMVKVNK